MELDDLKSILNKEVPAEKLTNIKFSKRKKWKSLHPAEKIKFKILIELISAIIICALYIYALFQFKDLFSIFTIGLVSSAIVFALVFQTIYYFKIANLLRFNESTLSFLFDFRKAIKQYIKKGCWLAVAVVIPIVLSSYLDGFVAGAEITYSELGDVLLKNPKVILVMFILTIIPALVAYFTAFGLYLLIYNRHIKQLSQLIEEFKEDNPNSNN